MGRLGGAVGIVTGGASGLGMAATRKFCAEGAGVVVADLNLDAAGSLAAELSKAGHSALAVGVDVCSRDSVNNLVQATVDRYGRIDFVLHCAGIARGGDQWGEGKWRPMEELGDEDWDRIVQVNLKGTFLVNQIAGIRMIEQRAGVIVNVASLSGVVANKGLLGHGAYCASKAGVIALTRVLATEWAQHGVRVNAISPASMDTGMLNRTKSIPGLYQMQLDMTPMARYGEPLEFAHAALFLVSGESGYINGHNLMLDGGYTAW